MSRIVSVKTHMISIPRPQPVWTAHEQNRSWNVILTEVRTDDGLVGYGQIHGAPMPRICEWVARFGEIVRGMDALGHVAVWEKLFGLTSPRPGAIDGREDVPPPIARSERTQVMAAIAGIDIALWDLKGRHLGMPVHCLMGGPLRRRVQAYATGFYRKRGGDPLSYLLDEARQRTDSGFTAIKLKLGFGIDEDVRLCRAVRRAVAQGTAIMVDANHAYDAVAAVRLGQQIEDLDICWFEEPVPPEDLDGYKQVKAALRIPIAGGEAEFTRWGFRRILVERAIDILQPDVCAAGGLSECKKIADVANAFGVRVNPHVWGTGVALAASLQLIAILPDNPPGLHPIAPLLEFDQSEHPIRMAVLTEPIGQKNGWVEIPSGSGLGIEIDRDAIDRFRVG
jgi:D-galactarolactone cycloisomerase